MSYPQIPQLDVSELQIQLKAVILSSSPIDVADLVASHLTQANSAALLLSAHQALELVYHHNGTLALEARDLNEDVAVHVAGLPRRMGIGLTAADCNDEAVGPLSMGQRSNRILEIAREIAEVQKVNQLLTRRIEMRLESLRTFEPSRSNAHGRHEEQENSATDEQENHTKRCCQIL
ncbi:hypothetical protein BST61_g2309 [Cercospora zeina]